MEEQIKNLGCMNGWMFFGEPKEYLKCRELGHSLDKENLFECYNRYTCPICKISYEVDSSG